MNRSSGAPGLGDLTGDKLYEQRGRAALPVLVRQARAQQTMFYGDLARELDMPNPRNLDYVLGAVGSSMLKLSKKWGEEVPPIQALVVNRNSGLPGEGIAWFAPDAADFAAAPRSKRERTVQRMLDEVYTFSKWDQVLAEFGLEPVDPPVSVLPPATAIRPEVHGGEGSPHQELKDKAAEHPEWFGLPGSLAPGSIESPLSSGDRVDVMFEDEQHRVAVEIKTGSAVDAELVRGLFQCVKYLAVMEAEAQVGQQTTDCRAILAIGGSLPPHLIPVRTTLGVELREHLEG